MRKKDIPYLDATDLVSLVKAREVSPIEVVEAYLERVGKLNPKLNAFLTICHDEAMEAARLLEKSIKQNGDQRALLGVPVAVKDQIQTKGIRTTLGSPIFKDFVPEEDATVIARLKASGAILIGKLNMTEFGTTGFSHQFRVPRNPWDLEYYTGGSSSGSAAATAGFLCATSLGEDTGGSIRFPAAWCGLVGLRPSWGRVSRHGVVPGVWSMDTIGPLSRTVADCAITLQAIAGRDPRDQYTWDIPVPDYRKALNGDIRGVRIGIVKEMLYSDVVDKEIRDTVVQAANKLTELGALMTEVSIPLSIHSWTLSGILRIEAPITHFELLKYRLEEIGHDNQIGYLTGIMTPAQAYYKGQRLRSLLRQEVLDALRDTDVLLMPTAGVAAQKVVPDPVIDSKQKTNRLFWLLTFTFSLANIPAINIPCGFTDQGLPIGLQIGGRPFEEEPVLRVAHAYEQNTLWHTRRPQI